VGQQGFETDTRKTKIGDGVTPWAGLPYNPGSGTVTNTGTLGANRIVLGNGSTDTRSAAAISTNGVSVINLGGGGLGAGGVTLFDTTGTFAATFAPPPSGAVTLTAPSVSGILAVTYATVPISGANTLTQASHSNRLVTWTGSTTAAQALPSAQTSNDFIEVFNNGTAPVTFTNVLAASGFKKSALPGEKFIAKTDGTNWHSHTVRVNSDILALTDGATITWDTDVSGIASVTLGGNRTLVINNAQAGGTYQLWVKQGSGGQTLTQPAAVKKASADSLSLSSGASALDIIGYTYNGTIFAAAVKLNIA
jgi:hypothetical protein